MNILFICTGNICRSLTAERLTEKLAKDRGLAVSVKSCGTAAQAHCSVPEPVWKELERLGIARRAHMPRLVNRDLLAWADLALTMTRAQQDAVRAIFPEFGGKVHLFRNKAGLGEEDIADPMGRSDPAYAAACASLLQAVQALLERL